MTRDEYITHARNLAERAYETQNASYAWSLVDLCRDRSFLMDHDALTNSDLRVLNITQLDAIRLINYLNHFVINHGCNIVDILVDCPNDSTEVHLRIPDNDLFLPF